MELNELEKLSNTKILYEKFIDANEVNEWDVLTPQGWINIEGIGKTILFKEWFVCTEKDRELICADTHILGRCDNIDFINKTYDLTECYVKDLKLGDYIMTIDGPEKICVLHESDIESNMYDLQISEGSYKHYYTNGFLSHNSLWLQNLAVNAVNAGHNVAYITLELSDKKALKRIGSMRLKIPIKDYTEKAKDAEFIRQRIDEVNNELSGGIFESKPGKLFIKEYPSGSMTISQLDNYIQQIYDETGINIDLLVVDYIQIMATEKGVDRNMLYLKGDHLAIGLRAIAQKRNLACLTATQIAKEKYNSYDIQLNDMPESKAIADTADMVWAIILTPQMKVAGKYQLKHVKLRDNASDFERIELDFNKDYLRLTNNKFVETEL